jgi:AraC family transcriptional regulator, transcriptional activator FtrA
MDLCLHVVRLDHGAEVANGVARMVVMPPHREGGQAQYIDQPIADRIAHQCGFGSAATLRHHFAERLGVSPRAYRDTFRGVYGATASTAGTG